MVVSLDRLVGNILIMSMEELVGLIKMELFTRRFVGTAVEGQHFQLRQEPGHVQNLALHYVILPW